MRKGWRRRCVGLDATVRTKTTAKLCVRFPHRVLTSSPGIPCSSVSREAGFRVRRDGKPEGLARRPLSVRELARGNGKGARANRREAIPVPAGFRGRRVSAPPHGILLILPKTNPAQTFVFSCLRVRKPAPHPLRLCLSAFSALKKIAEKFFFAKKVLTRPSSSVKMVAFLEGFGPNRRGHGLLMKLRFRLDFKRPNANRPVFSGRVARQPHGISLKGLKLPWSPQTMLTSKDRWP